MCVCARARARVCVCVLLSVSQSCPDQNSVLHRWIKDSFGTWRQMIITTRKCVSCKNHVARSKIRVTVHIYTLCICLSATCSCSARNFVLHGGIRKLFVTNDLQ